MKHWTKVVMDRWPYMILISQNPTEGCRMKDKEVLSSTGVY
jgi:hypothetical protein